MNFKSFISIYKYHGPLDISDVNIIICVKNKNSILDIKQATLADHWYHVYRENMTKLIINFET